MNIQRQSEQVGELFDALAKAQAEMGVAKKESDNPFYKSKYAQLSEVARVVKEPFRKNGLCYTHQVEVDEVGKIYLVTKLAKGAQFIASIWPITPEKNTPQAMGSAVSYAKRYSLSALAGVATDDEDDDGNLASGVAAPRVESPKRGVQQKKPEPPHVPETPRVPEPSELPPVAAEFGPLARKIHRELDRKNKLWRAAIQFIGVTLPEDFHEPGDEGDVEPTLKEILTVEQLQRLEKLLEPKKKGA